VENLTTQTFDEIKKDFARLREQMTPEVQALTSLILKLFQVLLNSLPKKRATSSTSHLPPTQDPHRLKNGKPKSKKKAGGQNGHKGSCLEMSESPDKIIKHPALECEDCGLNLTNTPIDHISRHQVVDIQFKKIIIEHQVEHKTCIECSHHQADPSAGAPIQYGPGLKATAVELNQVQCMPFQRCSEFLKQKFLLSLSPATLISFARQASTRLEIWEQDAKTELLSSNMLNADETGINVDGKNWWVHVLSSANTTLMIPHLKRGSEAMIETEILPHFHGILSHDFWASYANFDVFHAACHAHLQRELEKVFKDYRQTWAKQLAKLLLKANEEKEKAEGCLSVERMNYFEKKYTRLIKIAQNINPSNKDRTKSRGRIAQSYPRRLLNRLIEYRDWVLLFLYDPNVPFTNNQAEREIRMLKVQQKVSGYFKTEAGARDYCRIRSYILTMGKKGISKHEALTMLFEGT
jgi:transposase